MDAKKVMTNGAELTAAKAALLKDRTWRQDLCGAEIKAVLKKHNCTIDVAMILTRNGNSIRTEIVAN